MKTALIIIAITVCICVISFVVAGVTYQKNILSEYDTLQKCTDAIESVCKDDENCCLQWDEDVKVCKQGEKKDDKCNVASNVLSFIFGIIGLVCIIVLIIAIIIVLVEYFTGKKTTFKMPNTVYRYS